MTRAPLYYVLGIDQASDSGWALVPIADDRVTLLRPAACGLARSAADRQHVLRQALTHCGGVVESLLVVLEDHSKMPLSRGTKHDKRRHALSALTGEGAQVTRGTAQLLGMGDARGRWREQLDLLGHPERLRLMVEPRAWRARIYGAAGDTDLLKSKALTWASARIGRVLDDHNIAEGICLASWGAIDGIAALEAKRSAAANKRTAQKRAGGKTA